MSTSNKPTPPGSYNPMDSQLFGGPNTGYNNPDSVNSVLETMNLDPYGNTVNTPHDNTAPVSTGGTGMDNRGPDDPLQPPPGGGGGGSSSVRQNTQQAISEIDKPTHDFRKKVYGKAGDVMDREYEAYEGQRFADASGDTTTAQQAIRDAQGTGQQAYKDAAGVGQRISGQDIDPITGQSFLTGQGVDDYMSPHTGNVIKGMQDNAMRTMQMQRNQIGADSQMAGAGTGSRSAIEKAVMAGEVQRNLGQQVSGALEGSYAQAAQMKKDDMEREQQRQRYNQMATGEQGRLQLAGSQQQMAGTAAGRQAGYQDAQMLSRVGADIEGRQQNQLDAGYGDYLEERDWDKNNAMFASNVLSGAPVGTTTTSTTPQYQNQKVDRFGRIISGAGAGWLATGSPYGAVAGGVIGAMA